MIETAMTEALTRFLDVDVAHYKLIATNMANVDTPGYKTRDLNFQQELLRAGSPSAGNEVGNENEGGRLQLAAYHPVIHRVSGLLQRPDGNNVSVERESLLLAEAQMKFNLGIQLLKEEFHGISQAINSGGSTS
jgi:flagellar basal-body rod protein FlgB